VVEIDPMVVQVGRTYFHVNDYPRMNVFAQDARRFLRKSSEKYDLIFGDAYHGIQTVPAHLVTKEFFGLVKDRLPPDGIFMMNLISPAAGENSKLFASVTKTLSRVFEHVYVFMLSPANQEASQNIILVAASRDLKVDAARAGQPDVNPRIVKLLSNYVKPDRYDISKGFVFTDDINPVEYLVAETVKARK
jgi:spermidine synthase